MVTHTRSWLTVDTDDERHHPRLQGHPRRSSGGQTNGVSDRFLSAMEGFTRWHIANPQLPVTIFLIADQLEDAGFKAAMSELLGRSESAGAVLTIGCHGLDHRCWSAWKPDSEAFGSALKSARIAIERFARTRARPWFRAPAGYVAPWMAAVLAEQGFTIDSSVNPTALLRIKSGRRESSFIPRYNGWKAVKTAMDDAGVTERAWTTVGWPALPACGPALHIPILGMLARSKWRKVAGAPADENELQDKSVVVNTLYWHMLDHARSEGRWIPPLK